MTADLGAATTAIRDLFAAADSHPVEVGDRTVDPPSYVIHQVDGGSGFWAGIDNTHGDGTFAWQVTCAALTWEQCEAMRLEAVDLMLSLPDAGLVRCVSASSVRVHRDVNPHVWVATPQFHVTLT